MYERNTFKDLTQEIDDIQKHRRKPKTFGLEYPFYNYNDRIYMLFMTQIFRNLEIRRFKECEYLAYELDECLEMLMVDKGYYKCGFMVNNTEHLRVMFGKSTYIGAYNILFLVRHEFIIKTATQMMCFSIRLQALREILEEFPQFKRPLKAKVISCYARNQYFPLMKQKRDVVEQFNDRKDYE